LRIFYESQGVSGEEADSSATEEHGKLVDPLIYEWSEQVSTGDAAVILTDMTEWKIGHHGTLLELISHGERECSG
jgi:hypothetical protein